MSKRITQFCMGSSELSGCKGMCFKTKETYCTIDSNNLSVPLQTFPLNTLLRSWQLCSIEMILSASWPLPLQSKWVIILEFVSVIFLSFSLSLSTFLLSSECCHQVRSKKRLLFNSRCRGWGPHLGDIASLIPYCSWARSFLLYPLMWCLPKSKHCACSWVSELFNYLVKAQKGFWCPRIKVCIAGGIGSHICKLCRYSREVWVKTLMEVLLSRGWKCSSCLPGSDLILPIPIWSTDFCICPPIHLDSFTSDCLISCPLKNFHLKNPGASFKKLIYG